MQVNLREKKILITGGTGSLGKIFVKRLIKEFPSINKVIIFSRDEYKQTKLATRYKHFPKLEFIIGDVRDRQKLVEEFKGVDVVVHAAAMKCLDVCERNPEETYKTNVEGTANVIEAAIKNKVGKVVFISTDKAVEPISVYGHSKARAEQLILRQQAVDANFTILRLGNIFKSRGSVFNVFKEQSKIGAFTLYDARSTRYLIKSDLLYKSIIHSIAPYLKGAIVIPKLPIFNVRDLASAYCEDCVFTELPVRKGERVHELLFSKKELEYCWENTEYYYLTNGQPGSLSLPVRKADLKKPLSSENGVFLSIEELKKLIKKSVHKAQSSSF